MQQNRREGLREKVTGVLDILICLLLFFSAIYKGSFYKEDTLFINLVICMLGLVCLFAKIIINLRDNKVIKKSRLETIIDIAVIILPVSFFLPIMFNTAASRESALFEATRYVNLSLIYFIVRSSYNRKIYLTSIVLISSVVAIFGIDEITYRGFENILENLSINYLDNANLRISSTIQYANITALLLLIGSIILEHKVITNVNKLKQDKKISLGIFVAVEIFLLILLQTAVILTTSRMNILLLIVSTIIYMIYLFRKNNKAGALSVILFLLTSLILVSSIDNYLLTQNYIMIGITYILTFVMSLIYIVVWCGIKKQNVEKNEENKNKINLNTKTKYMWLALLSIIVVFVMFTPKALEVTDATKEGINVERNIYKFESGKQQISLNVTVENGEKYSIHLYEIDEKFNKTRTLCILPKDIQNGKYVGEIEISANTQKLQLVANVTNCKVSIDNVRIGDNKIKLAYAFLPDAIMFRLKDTLSTDSNNMLRLTYYKDSIKLFLKSPIIGIGGEGFKSRYQEVQTKSYVSSETHSMPLQILVEAGLVGTIAITVICITSFVIIYKLLKNKNKNAITYMLILSVFLITSLFDLVFSFGLMINLFAVIIGIIVNEYKMEENKGEDEYLLDNKSTLGMVKIATLSISFMVLVLISIYSLNMYRASMLIVKENSGEDLSVSYETIGMFEEKVRLDKTNVAYLTTLLDEYEKHIGILNKIYLMSSDEEERSLIKNESNNYIIKQKEVADKLIEYEYYNKYVLQKVASCYLENYVTYASIYDENFKNDEIAYVFYVGYGIKLINRIIEVGPENKVAKSLAYNVYNEYIPKLEKHNKLIGSQMLNQAILDMKQNFEMLKEDMD